MLQARRWPAHSSLCIKVAPELPRGFCLGTMSRALRSCSAPWLWDLWPCPKVFDALLRCPKPSRQLVFTGAFPSRTGSLWQRHPPARWPGLSPWGLGLGAGRAGLRGAGPGCSQVSLPVEAPDGARQPQCLGSLSAIQAATCSKGDVRV